MLIRKLYYLNKALKRQWWKKEDILKYQARLLRSLIMHSYKNVPFYRRLWKKLKIDPTKIKSVANLDKLPVITKNNLVNNYKLFFATGHYWNYVKRETSGLTGRRLKIYFDERCWDYQEALYSRSMLSIGYDPKKLMAFYWPTPLESAFHHKLGLMNKLWIPAELNEWEQIKIMQNYKPDYLYYFPSSLFFVAKMNKRLGFGLEAKAIMTVGEILSESMRKTIENSFCCNVYDQYGLMEFNRVAWQCKEKRLYHIDADNVVVEFLSKPEIRKGNTIITGLKNYMMPLIRYQTGDYIETSEETCNCGRNLPVLKRILGRSQEIITLNSGKTIDPVDMIEALAKINDLGKFCIRYMGNNKFAVDFTSTAGKNETITNKIKSLSKEKIYVSPRREIEINKLKGGKYPLLVCQ